MAIMLEEIQCRIEGKSGNPNQWRTCNSPTCENQKRLRITLTIPLNVDRTLS